jgi:opacity protein-like surface antigen
MEMQQIQAAVGATWDVSERVAFYAGALMHHVRIDQDRARIGGYPNTDLMIKNDDGGSMFGGYIGTQIGLTDNLYFTIEGSYTGDSKGGSAILGWNF